MIGDTLIIRGTAGRRVVNGAIRVNGSKNDAVQAIAAALLFRDHPVLTNLPKIDDVNQMLKIVERLGARVALDGRRVMITAPTPTPNVILDRDLAKKIRASILLTGPLLARYGAVTFPHPGGCVIGERPIDFFLSGFVKMGAAVRERGGQYEVKAPRGGLCGATIFFKNQTVTATETFLMAATLARGQTILQNCALEPEIENLGRWLIQSGAKISGLGTSTLLIQGRALRWLKPHLPYRVLPDRIEAGSFSILGALLARRLAITHCRPEHLASLLNLLREMGMGVEVFRSSVVMTAPRSKLRAVKIKTHEYPGFPTDLQAPLAVLLTQAAGQSEIFETIFTGRVAYAKTLIKMGAKIKISDPYRLELIGPTRLFGRAVSSPDLRAGLAYILAGLIAKGKTLVHNVPYINRGYERIAERFQALGLGISRSGL